MARKPNTDQTGNPWSDQTKKTVWEKGREIPNYSPQEWRWDKCGSVMNWIQHGNRNSGHGWEIDHIHPVANGGGDNLNNLQPLYWKHNADKGDSLNWHCP